MKKRMISRGSPFILAGLTMVFSGCPEQEDYSDDGREAAIEFCECYKENTREECLEKLKETYESYRYFAKEFIDAFNHTSTCGIELVVTQE